MGVLGITHPWIGEKWPCGGGPQLDLIDESLLSWREEGERVGWYGTPTHETMPYWYCEKIEFMKGMSILVLMAPKGLGKNGNSYGSTLKWL